MSEGPSERQLARLLEILPRAARSGGSELGELAEAFGTTKRQIMHDLTTVDDRAYYLPAGMAESVQILIEGERVQVRTTGEFRRPPRLTTFESLALDLALRSCALSASEERAGHYRRLAGRLEKQYLRRGGDRPGPALEMHPDHLRGGPVHDTIAAAARDRLRCRIEYLSSGAAQPQEREVDPYQLLDAGGRWYLIGRCHTADAIRVFRMDRILTADPGTARFEIPSDFDPAHYIEGGRVFRAEETVPITVRYSARIAPWIREQGSVEESADGSVLVRYRVADRAWLLRHVLEHGAEAEIVEPAEVRKEIRARLAEIARDLAAHGEGARAPDREENESY